jgi:NADH:quinone reductase (non-electrogenic)
MQAGESEPFGTPREHERRPRVVIVGGGFGGLYLARSLKRAALGVTLVDRRNFHLFQPLLYQVATGGLSPGDIASPLRHVLSRQQNTEVLLGEVRDLDLVRRRIILSDGEIGFDYLVLAAGSQHHYFGNEHWAQCAPGLKTVEDATEIRRRILLAFEVAEREEDPQRRHSWLTFAIIGGGPTGVELAGALAEIRRDTLKGDFRSIRSEEAEIVLIEADDQVLPRYPRDLAEKAKRALEELGVHVRVNTSVTDVKEGEVTVVEGNGTEKIHARTVLWAAGVQANPLADRLAAATRVERDRSGRIHVGDDLSVPGQPDVFVIGDMAHFEQDGKVLGAVAPVAMAQGRYVARCILARERGEKPPPFRYFDKGKMATIGRSRAVVDFGPLRFAGLPAWIAWLFVHLLYLVEFENRVLVLFQWAWNYFTHNRGARLITGDSPLPLPLSHGEPDHGGNAPDRDPER